MKVRVTLDQANMIQGGGNNVYGVDIPEFIQRLTIEQRKGFILMHLINTIPHESVMIHNAESVPVSAISELGIFGVYLSNGNNVILNSEAGYLMRTKSVGTNEGGVASGNSVLDSPLLVD